MCFPANLHCSVRGTADKRCRLGIDFFFLGNIYFFFFNIEMIEF